MYTVKPTHHVAVHQVNNGFCHALINALIGQHAFLNDDLRQQLFTRRVVDLEVATDRVKVFHVTNRHDSHAVGTVSAVSAAVSFYQHKRLLINAVFLVFTLNFGQKHVNTGRK